MYVICDFKLCVSCSELVNGGKAIHKRRDDGEILKTLGGDNGLVIDGYSCCAFYTPAAQVGLCNCIHCTLFLYLCPHIMHSLTAYFSLQVKNKPNIGIAFSALFLGLAWS